MLVLLLLLDLTVVMLSVSCLDVRLAQPSTFLFYPDASATAHAIPMSADAKLIALSFSNLVFLVLLLPCHSTPLLHPSVRSCPRFSEHLPWCQRCLLVSEADAGSRAVSAATVFISAATGTAWALADASLGFAHHLVTRLRIVST